MPARIEKIFDPARIVILGVLRLPGIAVGARLVHQGGITDALSITAWLTDSPGA